MSFSPSATERSRVRFARRAARLGALASLAAWAATAPLAAWAAQATTAANTLNIAVAGNFLGTLQKLAPLFAREGGATLRLSAGSTGALYAQIRQGAPFDVFLAADAERPRLLESAGLTVAGSRFTYAVGTLVLWSARAGQLDDAQRVLREQRYRFLALADPRTAPYGAAAREVLTALGLWEQLQQRGKLAIGTDVTQAWQFAASGNAELGFVALSQVIGREGHPSGPDGHPSGSYWLVPHSLYHPIDQDAVQIGAGAHRQAAAAFLHWLRSAPAALAVIRAAGYGT